MNLKYPMFSPASLYWRLTLLSIQNRTVDANTLDQKCLGTLATIGYAKVTDINKTHHKALKYNLFIGNLIKSYPHNYSCINILLLLTQTVSFETYKYVYT